MMETSDYNMIQYTCGASKDAGNWRHRNDMLEGLRFMKHTEKVPKNPTRLVPPEPVISPKRPRNGRINQRIHCFFFSYLCGGNSKVSDKFHLLGDLIHFDRFFRSVETTN